MIVKLDLAISGNASKSRFSHHDFKSPPATVRLVRKYVDRLDFKIRFKRILVEECGATTEVSHMQLAGDVLMLEEFNGFLQCHEMPWSSNVVFDSMPPGEPRLGPGFQYTNTQARLFRYSVACSSVKFGGGPESPVDRQREREAMSMPLTVM